ncbi:uncharacterized protein LOC119034480 isoform X3 [Acanthopagrus latus]|uniref:uncharacterized protein LOC119034480 isoform X3 n=1 Tax=Acanthopagrus latus TaxID=8177 RepID=UPI00187C13F0|nr:uncharacterized protein LOC119034480 isoform X3 [Acanthopagrus latus]
MLTESEISGLTCTKVACVRRECYCSHRSSQQIPGADRAHSAHRFTHGQFNGWTTEPRLQRAVMMDTQHQWSEALASNNIGAIIRWLRKLTAEGEADVEEIPLTFSSWVQRTSEFAKKELLTLCFSRCQGLWMFLDRSSFTRVHMLLQRLRNLLTLAQWSRRQLSSAHLWHGMGVPCVVCGDTLGSSDVRRGCWNREHRALKQHIWLGRLVQWWGIMGLLPKQPEAHEVKRISQMWKEMGHGQRKACLEAPGCEVGVTGRFSSLIQGMVTQLDRQHGCCTDQCYPPPNLQSLLKLVLVPHIDNMSVQALLMYFVLDMANFLQCKDDLLQSFCHAFTIPSSFSQQIRAFWMLDHGHVKASMELLLSPRAAVPRLSWQHGCIIHCLLTRKQPQLALSCVSEAWTLLKKGHTESNDTVMYFLKACDGVGLCAEALKYIPAGYHGEGENVNGIETTGSVFKEDKSAVRPPCPLSADLYRAQRVNTVSSEELVRLVRNAVMEVRKPRPKMSEVVWPEHTERKWHSREMFLSTQALRHLAPSPSPLDLMEETEPAARTDEPQEEPQPVQNQQPESPEQISPSEDLSTESVSSFTSASSLPLLRRQRCHIYESTLTLQRISSLLNDEENQSKGDEEEDSRTPSPFHALPECPELMLTLDGATDPIFLSNLDNDAVAGLVLSAEDGEDVETDVFTSKDFLGVDAFPGPSIDETFFLNKSTENNQSLPDLCEPESESHSFLSPDDEKVASCEEVSEETKKTDQEDHLDRIRYEIFDVGEAATFDCLLQEEPLWKTYENHQQEDPPGCFGQGFSYATSETTQDPQQNLPPSEDPAACSSRSSAGTSWDVSLFPPVCSSVRPTRFQQISGSFLTSSTTYNIKTTSAPSDTANEKDEPCFQRTSAGRLDRCETGSWWKQDQETCGASSGPPSATDAGTANTSDDMKSLLVLSQPPSYSLVNFMDFTVKQKGDSRDGKQANKEEPAGWSSFGRGSQGAIRSGRTRSRKGKRVKKA